ncbi:MAG: PQQ-dependent sugar dehydrogenase [Chthoniobacteraceae bacterium]
MKIAAIASLFLFALGGPRAIAEDAALLVCRWTETPIVLDGAADDPAWKDAQWNEGFFRLGGADAAATRTKFALSWDYDALYIFAKMDDRDMLAKVTEQDGQTWDDDVFEMFFKPHEDIAGYYEFQVNARNTHCDLFVKQSGDLNRDVEQGKRRETFQWKTAVVRDGTLNGSGDRDHGWSAEIRIPWSDFAPTGGRPWPGASWKMLLGRYAHTTGMEPKISCSTPLRDGGFHQPQAWGRLSFVGPEMGEVPRWETSAMIGTPEPPSPFRVERAFSKVKMHGPVAVGVIPGSDRMFLLENYGYTDLRTVLKSFDPREDASESETILELPEHGYSVTFHPKFAENGYFYLGTNGPAKDGKKHTRIVRYTMARETPDRIDPASRRVIIEWPSDGHNGGATAFGNDGMLYVTSGDGTGLMDLDNVGQDLSSLRSKVLRIDVDHPADGAAYRVPLDNPFVNLAGARPENWAYGMRNPWRISSDPVTGQLWVGDNGQDLREFAHLIQRGANYGWSVFEGSRPFLPRELGGPAPHSEPTIEHDHSKFRSLTGGIVYRGQKYPELVGAYIYGDYVTGRIWAAKHDGTALLWNKEIADTSLAITAFGADAKGELLIGDYNGGLYRLIPREPNVASRPFPRLLSETGLVTDTPTLRNAPGVIAYAINAPGWHDGATSEHGIAMPPGTFLRPGGDVVWPWKVDDGIVLFQTLTLEGRRIETRVLQRQDGDWAAYSYLWNAAQTDAELVSADGGKVELAMPIGTREWLVPSRTDCLTCHSAVAGNALTMNAYQLNRTFAAKDSPNQIRWLERNDLLRVENLAPPNTPSPLYQRRPVDAPRYETNDANASTETRARTYLAVNCAHCHVNNGGGNASMEMEIWKDLVDAHLLGEPPRHGTFGIDGASIIAPGDPGRSVLVPRISMRGPGQMPPVGSLQPDAAGVAKLIEWITSLRPQSSKGGQ